MTKCGKCGLTVFKLERLEPANSRFAFFAVQCSSCSTAIAITDFNNVPATLQGQEQKLQSQEQKLNSVSHELDSMHARLRHMEAIVVNIANKIRA